jgi:hypothetical protein
MAAFQKRFRAFDSIRIFVEKALSRFLCLALPASACLETFPRNFLMHPASAVAHDAAVQVIDRSIVRNLGGSLHARTALPMWVCPVGIGPSSLFAIERPVQPVPGSQIEYRCVLALPS